MTHHLMGTTEIAQMLGVSRQRAGQLVRTEGFPLPVVRLAAGPVWESADVDQWARETGRIS
jgi:predicted DNA-binding transcriptional regulator AlpA